MLGAGTQKIEEEARELFPEARIARLDSDVGSAEGKEIVNDFAAGSYDILIGTQIVTKGFDFGNLGLVAVIGADQILSQQDFRADERAFQLLSQFGGRAGRRERKGLVIIQTAQPEHPVLQAFVSGEPVSEGLLSERKAFNMPPYTRIITITLRHEDESILEGWAGTMSARLQSLGGGKTEGPYSPPVDISAGKHLLCFRIILNRDNTLKGLKKNLGLIIERFSAEFKCRGDVIIDVDPL
jgi:primosomal protein N' (replication factor Y)